MSKIDKEKEVTEKFRRLSPSSQANLISHIDWALFEAEAVKRQYGLQPGSSPAWGDPVVGRGKPA
jgi:hypothetical protein